MWSLPSVVVVAVASICKPPHRGVCIDSTFAFESVDKIWILGVGSEDGKHAENVTDEGIRHVCYCLWVFCIISSVVSG